MSRASTILAALSLGVLALPAAASAAPTVRLKAQLIPIKGFRHTGDILGAGAGLKTEVTIESKEYGGYPPPIRGVTLQFPTGTHITTAGFRTCPTAVLVEAKEPAKCPKKSKAGPVGHAEGFVVFGSETVPEDVTIESFFAPGGGVNFFIAGHHPAIIEITSKGRFTSLGNSGGYGPKFFAEVPLVETVPGANDASTDKFSVEVGAAYKKGKKTVYYGTVPKKCPKGGFPLKIDVLFEAMNFAPVTSSTTYKAPCPPAARKK
jgi:hypothetical protein